MIDELTRLRDDAFNLGERLNVIITDLNLEVEQERKVIRLQEGCQHETTQEIQGAGPSAMRTVCVDCGKEL